MHTSKLDSLLNIVDDCLKTLSGVESGTGRANPADQYPEAELSEDQRHHIAGLMRVNHSGEICAQGLYNGQALTAKLDKVRLAMQQAADEEGDHLIWCQERLKQLDSRTSMLNPLWYTTSFALGAIAGCIGDKVSLGFVAEIEEQVHQHLQSHLEQIPDNDQRTRAILTIMQEDESRHKQQAIDAGGADFPVAVKKIMSVSSKLMTKSSYRI